jgi:hypothetical protein
VLSSTGNTYLTPMLYNVSIGTGLGYSYGTHAYLREILAQTRHTLRIDVAVVPTLACLFVIQSVRAESGMSDPGKRKTFPS